MEAWQSGDIGALTDETLEIIDLALRSLSVYERVPLLGIIIALGRYLVNLINWGVTTATDMQNQAEAASMTYSKGTDEAMVQSVLAHLSSQPDYTPLFVPFTAPAPIDPSDPRASGIDHLGTRPDGDGVAHGVLFRVMGGDWGFGMHPGTTHIVRAWEYKTGDSSKKSKRKSWSYDKGYERARDGEVWSFEQFHPSFQLCSIMLWQRLLKNSIEMFALDANYMAGAWDRYFGALEMYLTLPKDDMGSWNTPEFVRPMTQGALTYLLEPQEWGCEIQDGEWAFNGVPIPFGYYTDPATWTEGIADTPAPREWRKGPSGPRLTARGVTRFIIDTQLRPRQYNALNTLTCAYLDEGAPAFSDDQLLALWQQRRQQLLDHPARALVDLELVPPGGWKQQLESSLAGIPPGQKMTAFVQIADAPAEPVTPGTPGAPARGTGKKKRKRGMGAAPLVLGAVALGFAATR